MKNDDIQLKEENKETPCFLESLQLAFWYYTGYQISKEEIQHFWPKSTYFKEIIVFCI